LKLLCKAEFVPGRAVDRNLGPTKSSERRQSDIALITANYTLIAMFSVPSAACMFEYKKALGRS